MMELGVQTHFSQGWNTNLLDALDFLGVSNIRDSQPWSKVELSEGIFNFPSSLTNYMDLAEADGVSTLLTFASANTLYDSGLTPYTAEGRQAYADYIVEVLRKYGPQVEKIEVWNEFNNGKFTGPAKLNADQAYVELLKTVWETVKPSFPDVMILGGSVNTVATGTLAAIFELNALDYMDAVAIHPYRSSPEHVDAEISHLRDVMADFGIVKPVFATEFGNQFADAADVPEFLLKMTTLMSSVEVEEAYWYALIDQKFFSNMGLLTTAGEVKPAANAFAFIQHELLNQGDAIRLETGTDLAQAFRYGENTYVLWGSERAVTFAPGGLFFDAEGNAIAEPTEIRMDPIVYIGSAFTFGESNIIADTLLQFGTGPWDYYAKSANGTLTELNIVDSDWTSYLGSTYTKPLRVNSESIAPAGNGQAPIQVVERFTSDKNQTVEIDGSWTTNPGDGIDLHILVNGVEVFSKIFVGNFVINDLQLTLRTGDTLDFAVGPNQYVSGDSTARHITLTKVEDKIAQAPETVTYQRLIEPQPGKILGSESHEAASLSDVLRDRDQVFNMGSGDDLFDFSAIGSSQKINAIIDLGEGDDIAVVSGSIEDYSFKVRSDGGIKIIEDETHNAVTFRHTEHFDFSGEDSPLLLSYNDLLAWIAAMP